jgi:beta-glucosidase
MCVTLSLTSFSQTTPFLTANNIDPVIEAMTVEEKAKMCCGVGTFFRDNGTGIPGAAGGTSEMKEYGIPMTYFADGPSGLRIKETRKNSSLTYPTVSYPSPILLASTWNLEASEQIGASIGRECKEYNISTILAPGMNILRFPLQGRTAEYFSEDPLLSGRLASAYVEGVQSVGVGTSIKHYAANNQETARKINDAHISMRALREIYLRGFEIAVKESEPWTVMSAYNKINGVYASENKWLLEDVLRDEWGFKGIVVSDWDAGMDGVKQISAGNDIVQPGYEVQYHAIIQAVKNGTLSESVLNRNVRRILEYVIKTPAYNHYQFSNKPDIAAHKEIAREIASEGIVLLKNEAALPLKRNSRIALYGNAGYSKSKREVSIQKGLRSQKYEVDKDLDILYKLHLGIDTAAQEAELTGGGMIYTMFSASPGLDEPELTKEQFDVQALTNDCAIIVLGQGAGESKDCSPSDFTLTDSELNLIDEVCRSFHKYGKKVTVILEIAIPIETASWKEKPDAIVCSWQSGQEKGNAIADILSGAVNPSGKLTVSFPVKLSDSPAYDNFPIDISYRWMWAQHGFLGKKQLPKEEEMVKNVHYTEYEEGIYVGYRYFDTKNVAVSFPFGFGLSYTTFSYDKPTVKRKDDEWVASMRITNTGKVAGKEVVQLYVSAPPDGILDKPEKELKAFGKTKLLKPGESETVVMKFSDYAISSFDERQNRWIADSGKHKALFGESCESIRQAAEFTLKNEFEEEVKSNKLKF